MQLSRQQIIHNLYTSENFCDCIDKMEPYELRQDLKQEVILVICELPEERLQELHEKNALIFFTVRVILNQAKSSTSPFYRKYRQVFESIENLLQEEAGATLVEKSLYKQWQTEVEFDLRAEKELYENEVTGLIQSVTPELTDKNCVDEKYGLTKYELIMLRLYYEHKTFRAIEAETKILWESCYVTINKAFRKISNYYKQVA